MPCALITLMLGLLMMTPISKIDRDRQHRLVGRYVGTSAFIPEEPADQPYAETTGVWFIFEDSTYYYGEGDTLPETDGAGDGGGPYQTTDSTVSLNGAYPKILRPVIVLRGTYKYTISGDTLEMSQSTGKMPGGGHRLLLVRK